MRVRENRISSVLAIKRRKDSLRERDGEPMRAGNHSFARKLNGKGRKTKVTKGNKGKRREREREREREWEVILIRNNFL